jgi:hypothetical protein
MVLGWLCCIHIHPHFKFIYEYALLTNDDQGDYQCLAFANQLLVDHIAIVWIGKEHLYYSSCLQYILPHLFMVCNLPWHPLHSQNIAKFYTSKQRRLHLEHEDVSMGNHGVLQSLSHLFSKQVQAQTILKQINYRRWVHIFTYQYPWKCFIIATN